MASIRVRSDRCDASREVRRGLFFAKRMLHHGGEVLVEEQAIVARISGVAGVHFEPLQGVAFDKSRGVDRDQRSWHHHVNEMDRHRKSLRLDPLDPPAEVQPIQAGTVIKGFLPDRHHAVR